MPQRKRTTRIYNKNSIDSKITQLCVVVKGLKDQMDSSLTEDKKMHGIINKWLLGLTILLLIEMFGGPGVGKALFSSLITKFAFAG